MIALYSAEKKVVKTWSVELTADMNMMVSMMEYLSAVRMVMQKVLLMENGWVHPTE
ncbi:hypothetical protein QTG54_015432 [Skeletonema marinoi]|uniref:Uncharacterized protein n=1 Tax=Skeletonema marinoi TaxID=267567 RepID=A0AAD9D5Q9_9STRA|nr:hypothetical protein QTG54_015432 [Skeletonema marinoi]